MLRHEGSAERRLYSSADPSLYQMKNKKGVTLSSSKGERWPAPRSMAFALMLRRAQHDNTL
ncbi:hypothetical protein ACFS5N_12445 [Mucilaginibacter ximonensis]|uniref:Uncharacterized protein n=1 Tax=Mucilaginibacter ximonensis TaxID=538021 RepID=A0ABW5YD83_9SPHI